MKDIKLDENGNVVFAGSDFALVDGVDRVLQHAKVAHFIFKNDWLLDYRVGIDHFKNLKENADGREKAEIKTALKNVKGIDRIISLTYERKNNRINVQEEVSIDDDRYTITEGLQL